MLSLSPLLSNNAVLWHIMPLHLPSPHALQLPPPYASTLATQNEEEHSTESRPVSVLGVSNIYRDHD